MRIQLIPALLIAGLSSVVAAAPGDQAATSRDEKPTARISYTDERPEPAPTVEGEWVEIADPTPAKHGKVYIPVGASAGQFTRLRIDVVDGRPHVRRIRIDFENGKSRVMKVGRTLNKQRQQQRSAYVDLHGARAIDQVVVITDRASKGRYTVHAEAGAGGVASR